MRIDWDKVVTQAVTTVVVGVFASACVIVWRGATTVQDRISDSEARIVHLINGVSEELSRYRAEAQTNMAQLRIDMSNQVASVGVYGPPSPQQMQEKQTIQKTLEKAFNTEQRVIKADLLEKLQYQGVK